MPLLIGSHALKQEVIDRLLPSGLTVTNTASSTLALAITSGKKLTLTSTGDFNLTIPETGTAALLGTFNIFTARQRINVNSAAALMVEQTGVKDCVLVVDTTNARVGVNCIPTTPFTVGCNSLFTGTIKMNANSTTALLVEQDGVKDNVLVVDTTNGRVGINKQPSVALDVAGDTYVSADVRVGSGLYVGQLGVDPADNWIYADGGMFINDTSNANMTIGLTINQGANDNEILALKSSDVAHGVTTVTETDTYFKLSKINADYGGAFLMGLAESTQRGFQINAYAGSPHTTKNANTYGIISIYGLQTSGTGITNATADAAVFTIGTYKDSAYKTIFIVDEDGDIAVDGSSSISTYDEYDDVKLLTGLRASLMPEKAELREQFSSWMEYAREPLSQAGIVTYNDDGHHFISFKGLHMLEIDAIRQLGEQITKLAFENAALMERLEQVDARLALLAGD